MCIFRNVVTLLLLLKAMLSSDCGGKPNGTGLSHVKAVRSDMATERVRLSEWLYGASKGRKTKPFDECIQYGLHLEFPKDEKYVVKHLNRRYQSEFGCIVSMRGRRQNEQKKLKFVSSSDSRKFLVASLYPMSRLTDAAERSRCLEAAEKHFDATLRDLLQVGERRVSAEPPGSRQASGGDVPDVCEPPKRSQSGCILYCAAILE